MIFFFFFEVNEHLMICWVFGYWLLCSERRENTLYKPLSPLFFKVIVAVYHGLLLIVCLCKTFSMEIFGFHVWSAMNLTWCSTSAWFTGRFFSCFCINWQNSGHGALLVGLSDVILLTRSIAVKSYFFYSLDMKFRDFFLC